MIAASVSLIALFRFIVRPYLLLSCPPVGFWRKDDEAVRAWTRLGVSSSEYPALVVYFVSLGASLRASPIKFSLNKWTKLV